MERKTARIHQLAVGVLLLAALLACGTADPNPTASTSTTAHNGKLSTPTTQLVLDADEFPAGTEPLPLPPDEDDTPGPKQGPTVTPANCAAHKKETDIAAEKFMKTASIRVAGQQQGQQHLTYMSMVSNVPLDLKPLAKAVTGPCADITGSNVTDGERVMVRARTAVRPPPAQLKDVEMLILAIQQDRSFGGKPPVSSWDLFWLREPAWAYRLADNDVPAAGRRPK